MKLWRYLPYISLVASCKLFESKSRIQQDSLSQQKRLENTHLDSQWRMQEIEQEAESVSQCMLIKADAPFHWNADSGLSGASGFYHLYWKQNKRAQKRQDVDNRMQHNQLSVKTEKSVQNYREDKVQASVLKKRVWLYLLSVFLLLITYGLWRWRRFRVFAGSSAKDPARTSDVLRTDYGK